MGFKCGRILGLAIFILLLILPLRESLAGSLTITASNSERAGARSGPIKVIRSKPKQNTNWHRRTTRHFEVFYQEKWIDPEEIYRELSTELDLYLENRGVKVKVYIQPGRAYVVFSQRKIVAWDETGLRHELTHLLFYQLAKSAPRVLQEGIATYMGDKAFCEHMEVDLDEITQLARTWQGKADIHNCGYEESLRYKKASAWVGNLVEEKGIEEFKRFFRLCKNWRSIEEAYRRIYG